MSWRFTALLWIVALVAIGAASAMATRSASATTGALRPLLAEARWRPDRVSTIVIERPDRPTIRLERVGAGWIERTPSGLPADPYQVQSALAAAGALRVSRVVDDAALGDATARRTLQIDSPDAVVTFAGGGETFTLRLGRRGVAGRAFVELMASSDAGGLGHPGDLGDQAPASPGEVAVVGQELHEAILASDPAQWRLRGIFPDAGPTTGAVEFKDGGTPLRVVRQGGAWTMELPVATRVDAVAMGAYLDALARAECGGFLEDLADDSTPTLSRFGLAEPAARIAVNGDGASREIFVGAPTAVGGSDRFGRFAGGRAIMRLDAATLAALFPNPVTLIDPTATGVDAADIKSIHFTGPQGDFSLRRDLDRWVSPEKGGAAALTRAVDELLRRLTIARAGSIVLRPIPRERMIGRVELRGFDGATLTILDVAADDARATFALDAGDGVARVFPAAQAPELSPAAYGVATKATEGD